MTKPMTAKQIAEKLLKSGKISGYSASDYLKRGVVIVFHNGTAAEFSTGFKNLDTICNVCDSLEDYDNGAPVFRSWSVRGACAYPYMEQFALSQVA